MESKVIHWNIRGYKPNYKHLRTLLSDTQASVACLQETRMPARPLDPPRGFSMYHKRGAEDNQIDYGGVCILIKNNIGHKTHPLNTNLQAVAVRCHLDRLYTICSIYLPPNTPIQINDLNDLLSQLPEPYMLLGDFNARSPLWGDVSTNQKGRLIENLLTYNNCSVLNEGLPTHFHMQTNSSTCIDLSIASSDAIQDYTWSVDDDLYNSDHFPVILTTNDSTANQCNSHFILEKADWPKYERNAIFNEDINSFISVDEAAEHFTNTIITSATQSIPKTKGILITKRVPWWNNELNTAVKTKKDALRRYSQTKLVEDKIQFNKARARVRYLIKISSTLSWRNYVSSINERTPIGKIWKRISRILGKRTGMHRPILENDNGNITDPKEVANTFGEHMSDISEGSQIPQFQRIKQRVERRPISFTGGDDEDYNVPLTMSELDNALKLSSNTSPGEDEVYYHMIRHLSETSMLFTLSLFNRIWSEGDFPSMWRVAIVIPFLKPGKAASNPNNYRPIALTSCICKLLERVVNARLVWNLEKGNALNESQYGFRRGRSTTDVLARIDSFIKIAFARKEHVVAVFFDLTKAYDTTWKHHILKKLYDTGFRGNLPIFIQNFLSNRIMKVRIGNQLSNPYPQHEGVPQGSVLSCTLFGLAINDLPSEMPQYVESSLYVDDFAVFTRSANLAAAERRVQTAVNKGVKWTEAHGFSFSPQKTVAMHFTKKRGLFPDMNITMGNHTITNAETTKFLGLILDRKLSYVPHLKQLKTKCTKSIDILKCLSQQSWGSDKTTLLRVYRSLIRSQLDYACQVYSSASKSSLQMLDPVHNQALRLCTGAFRSSPVVSLYAETGEPSLNHRRDKLSLQLYARILGMSNTPANSTITNVNYDHYFENSPRIHSTIGYRVRKLLQSFNNPLMNVMKSITYGVPPHTLSIEPLCPGIKKTVKSSMPANVIKNMFNNHISEEHQEMQIYTDGSKGEEGVGYGVILPDKTISRRLPEAASIYTAELQAILYSVAYLMRSRQNEFAIYCDSRSAITSITDPFSKHPIVVEIHRWLDLLRGQGKTVKFCWVPAHVGVAGNEAADDAAKGAVTSNLLVPDRPLPYRDYYSFFRGLLKERWADSWRNVEGNKLREIKDNIEPWITSCRKNRVEERILCRLRIGHTKLTHGHLMCGELVAYCENCIIPLTVQHILVECPDYMEDRRRYWNTSRLTLKKMLKDDEDCMKKVLSYLKDIKLYNMI